MSGYNINTGREITGREYAEKLRAINNAIKGKKPLTPSLFNQKKQKDNSMNGKQAKRLRKKAQNMTVGLPDKEYLVQPTMYEQRKIIVLGNCTRKAYKLLKRNYKRVVA